MFVSLGSMPFLMAFQRYYQYVKQVDSYTVGQVGGISSMSLDKRPPPPKEHPVTDFLFTAR